MEKLRIGLLLCLLVLTISPVWSATDTLDSVTQIQIAMPDAEWVGSVYVTAYQSVWTDQDFWVKRPSETDFYLYEERASPAPFRGPGSSNYDEPVEMPGMGMWNCKHEASGYSDPPLPAGWWAFSGIKTVNLLDQAR